MTLTVDAFSLVALLPPGVTGNPKNVATGIDNAINAGANFPDPFFDLFALTGSNLVHALSQLSGETAAGGGENLRAGDDAAVGSCLHPHCTHAMLTSRP